MKKIFDSYIKEDYKFDFQTMLGIIFLIVVISGVFGFVYEFIFYYFNGGMKEFYMQGGNFLPWINIYAIGALAVFFLTYRKRKNPILVFLISTLVCGVIEYFAGWFIYTFFDGTRFWDYNVEILNFGNIGGFICLRSVLFFGVSSLFLIYAIVPICFHLARMMNKKTFIIISTILFSIIMFDELYNLAFARVLNLPRASEIYEKLGIHYVKF